MGPYTPSGACQRKTVIGDTAAHL